MQRRKIILAMTVFVMCTIALLIYKSTSKLSKTTLRSYIASIDNNPSLFVNGKKLPMLGLRTTSDPYRGEKNIKKVLKYIDLAKKYNYSYVEVQVNWYTMDKSFAKKIKLRKLPNPKDISRFINWNILDKILDYAAKRNVYIILFFRHDILPRWWFELSDRSYLQKDQNGREIRMHSFNIPPILEYKKAIIGAIIERYRNHPAYLGFHLGFGFSNENNYPGAPQLKGRWFDYSEHIKHKFKSWVEKNYGISIDPPLPLSDLTNYEEVVEWINSAGDNRTEFYYWQKFRLEEKAKERYELSKFVKSVDPNHVLIMPASLSFSIIYYNSLSNDFDAIAENPYIDIVHFCPGMVKPWTKVHQTIEYAFAKYFEQRGKAVFIKWEGRKSVINDLEEPKKRAMFARSLGIGGSLWEGNSCIITECPEFSEEQIKIFAKTFLSTKENSIKNANVVFVVDPFIYSFDYRRGVNDLEKFSHYKNLDLLLTMALFYEAGVDFDIVTKNEILKDPNVLDKYEVIVLSNLYRVDEKLLNILIRYKNMGKVLFIQGRTGIANMYGHKDLNYLRKLLNVSSISEYKIYNYSWHFIKTTDLFSNLSGKKFRKSKFNTYYIPVFDYKREKYKVLAVLEENNSVAVVGYRDNVVFWFGRFGTLLLDKKSEEISIAIEFIKILTKEFVKQNLK